MSDLKVLNSPLVKFLGVTAIPANVIVNQKGIIVAKDIYGDDLIQFLNQKNP